MDRTLANRQRLLEELLGVEGPRTKPELVDRLSVSRSTVDRGLDELLEAGLVEAVDSSFRATEAGRLAVRERADYLDTLETIDEAMPILEAVPPGSLDRQFLRGAIVEVPDPQAPWTVFENSAGIVRESRSMRGTGPAVFRYFFEGLSAAVENGGLECELVVDETLFESLTDEELEALEGSLEPDGGRLLVTTLEDPFAIWIVEADDGADTDGDTGTGTENGTHAGVTVYGSGGVKGVIRSGNPVAVEWACEAYRERKRDADVVWDFG